MVLLLSNKAAAARGPIVAPVWKHEVSRIVPKRYLDASLIVDLIGSPGSLRALWELAR